MLIGMISIVSTSAKAQELDGAFNNYIGNPGAYTTENGRGGFLDLSMLRIGEGENFFGVYARTDEAYARDSNYVSRLVNWDAGLVFNSTLGRDLYDGGWYMKVRAGLGQSTARAEVRSHSYKDYQRDFNFNFGFAVGVYDPESPIFNRHYLEFEWRQGLSQDKELRYADRVISDNAYAWNNQLFKVDFTESVANFLLSDRANWLLNIDASVGFRSEYPMVYNLGESLKDGSAGLWVSIYKAPYFQQNLVKVGASYQFGDRPMMIFEVKFNVIAIIFGGWHKGLFLSRP